MAILVRRVANKLVAVEGAAFLKEKLQKEKYVTVKFLGSLREVTVTLNSKGELEEVQEEACP